MRRRKFLGLVGGAAAWPLTARAQAKHLVGFLGVATPSAAAALVGGFQKGLKEGGFDAGDVEIVFRWADGHYDQLPKLAAELVEQRVSVLFGGGPPAASAAKGASSIIPVVFTSGDDPVKTGLVASLARPGGNVTGVSNLVNELEAKRLELLHEMAPSAKTFGFLFHPRNSTEVIQAAARQFGLAFHAAAAGSEQQLGAAFASLFDQRVDAVVVGADPTFYQWRSKIIGLLSGASIPAIYETGIFATEGGLISYGTNFADVYRQAGLYVAKIIKGEKPSNLPVLQPTKFDLVINLRAAKALGLTVPPTLLARADEVIE